MLFLSNKLIDYLNHLNVIKLSTANCAITDIAFLIDEISGR